MFGNLTCKGQEARLIKMNKTLNTCDTINISQVYWLNLIPNLYNKDVLKVGTERTDNIMTIVHFDPKTLSCIGQPDVRTEDASIKYYETIDEVPSRVFDLIIFDEPKYLTSFKSFLSIKKMLLKISLLLRDEGILLLCFPDSHIQSLKYRYWIKKALSHTGFNCENYFFCTPTAEHPLHIIPYSEDSEWLVADLPNFNDKTITFKKKIKRVIKKKVFKTMGMYNPFRGLMLITGKSAKDMVYNEYILKIAKACLFNGKEKIKPFIILGVRGCVFRQYFFIYNAFKRKLLLIGKTGFEALDKTGDIRQEYENLTTLSKHKILFNERNIEVPTPILFESDSKRYFAVQSAVPGISVGKILRKYILQDNRKAAIKVLGELINILIFIQNVCTKRAINSTPRVKNDYFDNYVDIHNDWDKDDHNIYSNNVQHGDFTIGNIYIDTSTNKWGIIDWEDMAKGYPHLFDIFSLFTSIQFINEDVGTDNNVEYLYLSFIHTYFCENWFSNHLKSLVDFYCNSFQLDNRYIFHNLIAYLLFQRNKYKLIFKEINTQKLYEKMLHYSIKNEKDFVLK
jgi:hypothetical protein